MRIVLPRGLGCRISPAAAFASMCYHLTCATPPSSLYSRVRDGLLSLFRVFLFIVHPSGPLPFIYSGTCMMMLSIEKRHAPHQAGNQEFEVKATLRRLNYALTPSRQLLLTTVR